MTCLREEGRSRVRRIHTIRGISGSYVGNVLCEDDGETAVRGTNVCVSYVVIMTVKCVLLLRWVGELDYDIEILTPPSANRCGSARTMDLHLRYSSKCG